MTTRDDQYEDEPLDACPRAGDPRDPEYDPEHDWEEIGDADLDTVYKCRRCKKSKLG